MKVSIKRFDVDMEIKNKGIELDVCEADGSHIGDLVVTRTKLIWCSGKTDPRHGLSIEWNEFVKFMEEWKPRLVDAKRNGNRVSK